MVLVSRLVFSIPELRSLSFVGFSDPQKVYRLVRLQVFSEVLPDAIHCCRASIRTLSGPLVGPVHVGVRFNSPGPLTAVMDLGIVGAAIYGAISMDQHSKRSHPNKAADVVFAKLPR